jgi:transcriptional regulator with XRE-family HTH domain
LIDITTTFAVISWKKEAYRIMIADKIKNARTIKQLIQEQVAEDLNVSRQTISNWENGKSLPDIVSIIRMSELYDLSLDELLKGDATLLNKIERDMKVAKAENNVIKFAWISIVRKATEKVLFAYKLTQNKVHQSTLRHCI